MNLHINRRAFVKLSFVAVTAAQFLTAAPALVGAQAAAPAAGAYVSPTYGYSLAYDTTWQIVAEESGNGEDFVALGNGASTASLYAYPSSGTVFDCVDKNLAWLETVEGVQNIAPALDEHGSPVAGGDDVGAYARFTYDHVDANGMATERSAWMGCLALHPGQAVLELTALEPGGPTEEVNALLNGLDVGGQPGQDGADGTLEEPAPQTDMTVGDFAVAVGGELDAFWADQFAGHGEYFIRPFVRAFDQPVDTACDTVALEPGFSSVYCGYDQTVYLDIPSVLDAVEMAGPAAFDYTLAHEWAHHVQMQLGMSWEVHSVESELQADCLAGAFLADVVAQGHLTIDDIDALAPLVISYGDAPETLADEEGAHGEGTQRWSMFLRGFAMAEDGHPALPACDM